MYSQERGVNSSLLSGSLNLSKENISRMLLESIEEMRNDQSTRDHEVDRIKHNIRASDEGGYSCDLTLNRPGFSLKGEGEVMTISDILELWRQRRRISELAFIMYIVG